MTENEAVEILKNTTEHTKVYEDDVVFTSDFAKAYEMAIKALEKQSMVNEILHELKEYSLIGTIEEFKALKEKNTIIKVIDIRKSECPEDIEYFGSDELFGKCPHCEGMVNHTWNPCSCGDCGGLIDWSE